MSAWGQSRRFDIVRVTSALPLIADLRRKDRHVRLVPNSEVDYFDRPKQQAVLSSVSWWRIFEMSATPCRDPIAPANSLP